MRSEKIYLEVAGKEIEVKAPTVGVLENVTTKSSNEITQSIIMSAICTNMSEKEIRDLDPIDFMSIQKVLQSFLRQAGIAQNT